MPAARLLQRRRPRSRSTAFSSSARPSRSRSPDGSAARGRKDVYGCRGHGVAERAARIHGMRSAWADPRQRLIATSRWVVAAAGRMTAMISLGRGGSGGYCIPLLCGARPAKNPGTVAGDLRRPAASIRTVTSADIWGSSQSARPGRSGPLTTDARAVQLPARSETDDGRSRGHAHPGRMRRSRREWS